MNSSRSDVVTHFIRLSVTKEFFLSLKSFNGVSRKLKGCLKCAWCFKDVKEVLRVYTEIFKGVSMKMDFDNCGTRYLVDCRGRNKEL